MIPRPAATIILLRDSNEGPEVFMLKRNPTAVFHANAYVFPGGGLDDADGPRARHHAARLRDRNEVAKVA